VPGDRKREAPAATPGPRQNRSTSPQIPASITDPPDPYGIQRAARERVRAIGRNCRIARMAEQVMPMAVWYRQPKGAFYCTVVEGWGRAA
jgi:hypothetical protein